MLSLKLNFDKFTAWLHLPQGGRKTGAMQRFFLYDLPFRYLSYTKDHYHDNSENIPEGNLPHCLN